MPQLVKESAALLVEESAALPILHDARPMPEDASALPYESVALETLDSAVLVSASAAGQVPGKGVPEGTGVSLARSCQSELVEEVGEEGCEGVLSSFAETVVVRFEAECGRRSFSACAS
jgi:hypothetical protein